MGKKANGMTAFVFMIFVVVALGVGLGILVHFTSSNGSFRDESIPQLVILGGIVTLVLIFIGAGVLFKAFDIGDASQAFGLPDGSIRAVVATMALLLFGIVPLFLFTTLSQSRAIQRVSGLTAAEAIALKADLKDRFVSVSPALPVAPPTTSAPPKTTTPPTTAAQPATQTTAAADTQRYTVFYRDATPDAAVDLSKQFFTTLATLVAAMSSFFFGSAVASSSAKAGATAATASAVANINPSIKGVAPSSINVSDGTLALTLSGSGLNQITKADLIQGTHVISGTGVTSSQDSVKCSFAFASDTPTGKWAVEITSSDTPPKTARLDDAIALS